MPRNLRRHLETSDLSRLYRVGAGGQRHGELQRELEAGVPDVHEVRVHTAERDRVVLQHVHAGRLLCHASNASLTAALALRRCRTGSPRSRWVPRSSDAAQPARRAPRPRRNDAAPSAWWSRPSPSSSGTACECSHRSTAGVSRLGRSEGARLEGAPTTSAGPRSPAGRPARAAPLQGAAPRRGGRALVAPAHRSRLQGLPVPGPGRTVRQAERLVRNPAI